MNALKLFLIITVALFLLAALLVVTTLAVPFLISVLMGIPATSSCGSGVQQGQANLNEAVLNLCSTSQSFFGISAMIVIAVWGFFSFISNVLATFELYKNSMDTGRKIIWFVGCWAVPMVGVLAYYLVDRKKFISG